MVCPCRAMRWKIEFSVSRSLGGHDGLAVPPARRDHLGRVVAGDAVEQVEGDRVAGDVGRLVDDEGGRRRVEGGELGVERGLALPVAGPPGPPSTLTLRIGLVSP